MISQQRPCRLELTAALSMALMLSAASASAVTVDGDLSDLISAVGASPYNALSATDPLGSADSPTTESNNGFDISNVFAYYDLAADVLYLGMNFYGTVGDSQSASSTATHEGLASCATTYCNRSIFDLNETYRFQLYDGTSIYDTQLLSYSVVGENAGGDHSTGVSNPNGLVVTHAVSEANNGVEFSIAGLGPLLAPFGFSNPADLLIYFGAGSADINSVSNQAEDSHSLQLQVVPVPAAVWLFGSGLAGLLGISARKQRR